MKCNRMGQCAALFAALAMMASAAMAEPAKPDTPTHRDAAHESLPDPHGLAPAGDTLNDLLPSRTDDRRWNESWWQGVVNKAPGCRVFSDGCRRCDPSHACSGLPIACQPKDFQCVEP